MSNSKEASTEIAQRNRGDLGNQYGQIGISAVAAALPYGGQQKNHAYAPAKPRILTLRDLERLLG
jgi:hypothetical protein